MRAAAPRARARVADESTCASRRPRSDAAPRRRTITATAMSAAIRNAIGQIGFTSGPGGGAQRSPAGAYHRPRAGTPAPPAILAAMPTRLILARPRGYCAGVERAVDTVERMLE